MPPTDRPMQAFLAGSIVLLVGAIVFTLLFRPVPLSEQAGAVLNMLIGVLVGSLTAIVSYYFGSSAGSKAKDDAQAQIVQNLTGPGSVAAPVVREVARQEAERAAPPAAEEAAPPAAEAAVERELDERGIRKP